MPLSISVVIPYYNRARFIGEALASVRAPRRASRREVTMSVVLSRIAWRVIGNRWRQSDRIAHRTPVVTTDGSA
jgi:hypothetical protein